MDAPTTLSIQSELIDSLKETISLLNLQIETYKKLVYLLKTSLENKDDLISSLKLALAPVVPVVPMEAEPDMDDLPKDLRNLIENGEDPEDSCSI